MNKNKFKLDKNLNVRFNTCIILRKTDINLYYIESRSILNDSMPLNEEINNGTASG